jgi:hypothetical protein
LEPDDPGIFVKKLRPTDEIAREITGNTTLFFDELWVVKGIGPSGPLPTTV